MANLEWMRQQAQDWDEATTEHLWRVHLTNLLEELELLEDQLQTVTQYLDRYLAKHPGGTLLRSIPGVGPCTAEAILAYTDKVKRFARSKQYGAYFGLTPKLDESGSVRRLGHISKERPGGRSHHGRRQVSCSSAMPLARSVKWWVQGAEPPGFDISCQQESQQTIRSL